LELAKRGGVEKKEGIAYLEK
jgi:hypothetical protein